MSISSQTSPLRYAASSLHQMRSIFVGGAGAGLIVDIEGIDELAMAMRENAPAFELLCQLNVTFFHDEPDVRRTIPSVPG